eukprot:5712016-Pyramimonas_sp.AAC.3
MVHPTAGKVPMVHPTTGKVPMVHPTTGKVPTVHSSQHLPVVCGAWRSTGAKEQRRDERRRCRGSPGGHQGVTREGDQKNPHGKPP